MHQEVQDPWKGQRWLHGSQHFWQDEVEVTASHQCPTRRVSPASRVHVVLQVGELCLEGARAPPGECSPASRVHVGHNEITTANEMKGDLPSPVRPLPQTFSAG